MFRHGDTSSDERGRIKAKPMEVRVATFQEIELSKEKQRWERLEYIAERSRDQIWLKFKLHFVQSRIRKHLKTRT